MEGVSKIRGNSFFISMNKLPCFVLNNCISINGCLYSREVKHAPCFIPISGFDSFTTSTTNTPLTSHRRRPLGPALCWTGPDRAVEVRSEEDSVRESTAATVFSRFGLNSRLVRC